MMITRAAMALVLATTLVATGCDVNSALERLLEARRLSSDLLVQFTKAADASSRAVMSDTDDASIAFAREAEESKQRVQKDAAALKPLLKGLGYDEELRLLETFESHFAEYRTLDQTILELTVQNTNLKAQRLSFGPALEAADSFRDSLEGVVAADAAKDNWRAKALVATAVARVREIQALQAPHIADPDDASMTRQEQRMTTAEASARSALATLAPLVPAADRLRLATATTALDQFMNIHAQILTLSRRNTNVRSLALSLNQKGKVTVACEQSLQALRDALAKRGFSGTR